MKLCQTLLRQCTQRRGRTRNKRKDPQLGQKTKTLDQVEKKEEWEKVIHLTPSHHKKHLRKGEGKYTIKNT
jgi:Ribonuclease G/E